MQCQFAVMSVTSDDDDDSDDSIDDDNTYIRKAHLVNSQTESEAPAVVSNVSGKHW